jgi:DNA modification methylase
MLIQADARHIPLRDESVQCVVTSPPYWGLRDYKADGQLGLERTPEEYVANIVEVFREVWRVLREDGVVWLVLGDSYAASGGHTAQGVTSIIRADDQQSARNIGQQRVPPGLKPKDLVGIPWRVAFALQADGWYLRQDIIWAKGNPMPESVRDRCCKSHEYMFLLTKSPKYFFDSEAINSQSRKHSASLPDLQRQEGQPFKRTARSVWHINTEAYPEAHYATFPRALVERCILAGTSEKGACVKCGAPWERMTETLGEWRAQHGRSAKLEGGIYHRRNPGGGVSGPNTSRVTTEIGWQPACSCGITETRPCIVYDPFVGSGTVVMVARDLGRMGVGSDLKYFELSKSRIYGPLFAKTINA